MMDVVVHDFSGHPFQAELARKLAANGHQVRHVSAPQYVSGKGHLERLPGDPPSLRFDHTTVRSPFRKYTTLRRIRWELAYGRAWVGYLKNQPADAVIMSNFPLFAMLTFVPYARRHRVTWVLWHQDIYSRALAEQVRRRVPRPLAGIGTRMIEAIEAWSTRNASHVVAIGEAFTDVYPHWGVQQDRVSVIANWAPLDKIVPGPRDSDTARRLFDADRPFRLLYAGTLGLKHNPELLIDLLREVLRLGIDATLTVVSEGPAADRLRAITDGDPDLPLRVLPFQPAADLSDALAAADVLIALLEPDATAFSIPSKVMSYLAAGRPIAALVPADNPAALDVAEVGGWVDEPTPAGARAAARWATELANDPGRAAAIGKQGRALAEDRFNLDTIGARFEEILYRSVESS